VLNALIVIASLRIDFPTIAAKVVLALCLLQSYLKSVYASATLNVLSVCALVPSIIIFCSFRYGSSFRFCHHHLVAADWNNYTSISPPLEHVFTPTLNHVRIFPDCLRQLLASLGDLATIISRIKVLPPGVCTWSVWPAPMQQREPVAIL